MPGSEPRFPTANTMVKLLDFKYYMPEDFPAEKEGISVLARHLGTYFSLEEAAEITPSVFMLKCELAINDLQTKIHSIRRTPIQCDLLIQRPIDLYHGWLYIQHIAKVIFPTEFAEGVQAIFDKVTPQVRSTLLPG